MKKRWLIALGLAAVFVLGTVQFETAAKTERSAAVLCPGVPCAVCPDGYVLKPTPGNCCRCVKVH